MMTDTNNTAVATTVAVTEDTELLKITIKTFPSKGKALDWASYKWKLNGYASKANCLEASTAVKDPKLPTTEAAATTC